MNVKTKLRSCCTSRACSVNLIISGMVFIVMGFISAVTHLPQNIVDQNFRKHLTLSLDSPVFDLWMTPPTPVYLIFYVFNVTNIDEFIGGKRAKVKEFGPYTYEMDLKRFDVRFFTNDTVAFRFRHLLHFRPDMSTGTEDDVIYHLNMPLVTIAGMMENMPLPPTDIKVFELILNLIGEKDLIVPHSAREIIFGYVDPFFELLSELASVLDLHYDPMFGPFYKFNNSDDGLYLVNTGRSNYSLTNEIQRWNGEEYLTYWPSQYANMLNGTDGSFFRPHVKRNEKRYMYFSDMCRSLELQYERESSVKGVSTVRFHFADDLLANASIHPDNADFCVPPGNCYDSGVLNVAQCRQGAPAILSLPHFYNAATLYQQGVDGMHPDKEKHDSVFDVEPISGIVFYGGKKVQINMEVKSSKHVKQMQNVQPAIFPYFWTGGESEMDDNTISEFRGVLVLVGFMNVVAYVMLAMGFILLCLGVLCCYKMRQRRKYEAINDTTTT